MSRLTDTNEIIRQAIGSGFVGGSETGATELDLRATERVEMSGSSRATRPHETKTNMHHEKFWPARVCRVTILWEVRARNI